MTSSTSPTSSGSSARGRLVEQHQLRAPWRAPGRSRPAAAGRRRAARGRRRPCRPGRPGPAAPGRRSRASPRLPPLTRTGASMTFSSAVRCGNRLNRWNTMPMSRRWRRDLASPQLVQLAARAAVADQLAVDADLAAVDALEVVDAAQERALARAGRARACRRPRPAATSRSMPLSTSLSPKLLRTPAATTIGTAASVVAVIAASRRARSGCAAGSPWQRRRRPIAALDAASGTMVRIVVSTRYQMLGDDQQRDLLEVAAVDELRRGEQLGEPDDAGTARSSLSIEIDLVGGRRHDQPRRPGAGRRGGTSCAGSCRAPAPPRSGPGRPSRCRPGRSRPCRPPRSGPGRGSPRRTG